MNETNTMEVVKPKLRNFICLNAHPKGCQQSVKEQIELVQKSPVAEGPKNVLIVGASTGYGLSTRIAAAFGYSSSTVGVYFERPATEDKGGSAGWYNSLSFVQEAKKNGLYAKDINGDAFSNEIKQEAIDLIKKDLGKVDLVIYSLASPRRKDPNTGEVYSSCLKTTGRVFKTKTIDVDSGLLKEVELPPATEKEIEDTIKVMGGEDWQLWCKALKDAGVLAENAKIMAYTYIGPELTGPIYREGTIGAAKKDLEKTAKEIEKELSSLNVKVYTAVDKAVASQASAAIPAVPLYLALLYKVMKQKGTHESIIQQIHRLLKSTYQEDLKGVLDNEGRIRMDNLEMDPAVQKEVQELWNKVTQENLDTISDYKSFKEDFLKLFGFNHASINYDEPVDTLGGFLKN
jgi:enoyl-[acyl-carrier protein] reductase/trans-2-enoyl-CoA reductase (NAD+)